MQSPAYNVVDSGDGNKYLSDNGEYSSITFPVTSVNNQTGDITINVPTLLSELTDDSTHRLVTDTEKSTWNDKQDSGDYATNTDLTNGLSAKVDKITGKDLSTNDLTNALKSNYDTAYTNSHTHSNKTTLDATTASFTSTLKASYDGAVTNSHTHANKTDLDQVNKNFTITYDNGQLVRKTYSSNDYITFSYNIDCTINQKKYYTSDDVLYRTQTAQYSDNLFIGWA